MKNILVKYIKPFLLLILTGFLGAFGDKIFELIQPEKTNTNSKLETKDIQKSEINNNAKLETKDNKKLETVNDKPQISNTDNKSNSVNAINSTVTIINNK